MVSADVEHFENNPCHSCTTSKTPPNYDFARFSSTKDEPKAIDHNAHLVRSTASLRLLLTSFLAPFCSQLPARRFFLAISSIC
jgi:hypothetical protein